MLALPGDTSPVRHVDLTFRHLTGIPLKPTKSHMEIVTVKRRVKARPTKRPGKFSDLGRSYFDREWPWHFALEALAFGALAGNLLFGGAAPGAFSGGRAGAHAGNWVGGVRSGGTNARAPRKQRKARYGSAG